MGETAVGWTLAMIATAAALIGPVTHVERTQLGRRLRATAQDPDIARALGIPVPFPYCFALAGAPGGGGRPARRQPVLPVAGGRRQLHAEGDIAVVIGGWGRIWGAVISASC